MCCFFFIVQTEPQAPVLNLSDQIIGLEHDDSRTITIFWQEPISTQHRIYHITVEPGIQGCNTTCKTENSEMELELAVDTAYNVTIIAVVCNGSLQSTKSQPLQVLLNGMLLYATNLYSYSNIRGSCSWAKCSTLPVTSTYITDLRQLNTPRN